MPALLCCVCPGKAVSPLGQLPPPQTGGEEDGEDGAGSRAELQRRGHAEQLERCHRLVTSALGGRGADGTACVVICARSTVLLRRDRYPRITCRSRVISAECDSGSGRDQASASLAAPGGAGAAGPWATLGRGRAEPWGSPFLRTQRATVDGEEDESVRVPRALGQAGTSLARSVGAQRRAAGVTPCALGSCRSQELHLRTESHSYLPELGKSEMEFIESKRPRLELLPDPLLRPSPLLATGQPGGSEDLSKVRPGPRPRTPLLLGGVRGAGEAGGTAWEKAGRRPSTGC